MDFLKVEQVYTRLLGFDFGTKKIGVAYGQTVTQTAQPLCILPAKDGVPQWAEIQKLIDKWRPQLLIVGLPLNMDGTEQPITQAAREFTAQLAQQFALPVTTMDERLSTIEARALVFAHGGYKALQEKKIDAVAAVLILESWMQTHAQNT